MCGITGIFSKSQISDRDRTLLKQMSDVLSHRGPDGEGFYFENRIGLAHRRLSIIDLEGGKQPLSNEDGSVWVTFNGEIYNYLEIREELVRRGHKFVTSSDTEVIVHLYEEKGDDFVDHLRGMFAIGLWDARRQRLVLVRDRLGKKPLFYAELKDRIVFASELKSLLQVPGLSKDIDREAVVDYFSLLYVPAPKSIYRQIRKVRPGQLVVFDSAGKRERGYWDIEFGPTEEEKERRWSEELLQVYQESVRIRMRSDVPLGAFLSGGVDSSSVVALMARANRGPVNTCSVGFDEKEFDESADAARFAKELGTEHHEERVRPHALSVLDRLTWFYDEPFADSSAVPTYYVSQAARRHVTVTLSGDGGDENFAGYRRYYHDVVENQCRSFIPDGIRAPLFGALGRWYPKLDWAPQAFRAQATFRALARDPVAGYFYSVSAIKPEMLCRLFTSDFLQSIRGYTPLSWFKDIYERCENADHLSRLQYLDIKTYLTDDILVKVDRASMAVSLEVRCPILDHKLMELAAKIPSSLKLKNGVGKYIFKKSLETVLPPEILTRRKQGFAVPLAVWFRGELKDISGDLLLSDDPLGVLRSDTVAHLWKEHQSALSDHSTALWSILVYRLWQNTFLSGAVPVFSSHHQQPSE